MGNEKLLQRFLKYVRIWTTSDSEIADTGVQPSTQRQLDLAKILLEEMNSLGLKNCRITEHGYVYGILEGKNSDERNSFALMAHMDTVEEVSGKDVNAVIIEENKNGRIDSIIKTDGNTLLGADDKAGIAAIMDAVEYFAENPEIPHGNIEIIFSPDEETGHGMDNFENDFLKPGIFKSKFAYTVDGGSLGELESECFNAYKVDVIFKGRACHTGSAKNFMVNAVTVASEFLNLIPKTERPETTEGKEGFYAVMGFEGTIEEAKVYLFLRDFEKEGMEKRLSFVRNAAVNIATKNNAEVEIKETFQYENMKEGISKMPFVLEKLRNAYKKAGVEPVETPIRGGTDGSRLTEMGIPSPNIFTGGHNFHSREEWCSLNEMAKASEVVKTLIQG